ncbi:hypothetical protein V8D89_013351 [Ganoderma adspersum]
MASRATLALSRTTKRLISPQCTGRLRLCSRALWTVNATLYSPTPVSCDPSRPHRTPAFPRIVPQLSRTISSSIPRRNTAVAQSFADPDRSDLFYHLFTPPTSLSSAHPVFALSFLPTPPPSVVSSSVIGWLPASGEGEGAGLNDFVENDHFREVLHEAIQSALHDGVDEVQKNGAIQTQEGWMHIHDNRNLPALGRIGDPDDIIASVRVENGEILAETYQPMPSYRLCTADGVLQLTDGLATRLVEILKARVLKE